MEDAIGKEVRCVATKDKQHWRWGEGVQYWGLLWHQIRETPGYEKLQHPLHALFQKGLHQHKWYPHGYVWEHWGHKQICFTDGHSCWDTWIRSREWGHDCPTSRLWCKVVVDTSRLFSTVVVPCRSNAFIARALKHLFSSLRSSEILHDIFLWSKGHKISNPSKEVTWESIMSGDSDPWQDWRSTITFSKVCPCALCAVIAKVGTIGTWVCRKVMPPPNLCWSLQIMSMPSLRTGTLWGCRWGMVASFESFTSTTQEVSLCKPFSSTVYQIHLTVP